MGDESVIGSAKKGSADVLILALLEEQEDLHGYEISRRIEGRSGGTLRFTLTSLYETLYRLEERGWLVGRWVERPGMRRRRSYRLTAAGRAALVAQRRDWGVFIAALTRVAGVETA